MVLFLTLLLFISTYAQYAVINTCPTDTLDCDAFAASYPDKAQSVCCSSQDAAGNYIIDVYASTCYFDCNDPYFTLDDGYSMANHNCGPCCVEGEVCDDTDPAYPVYCEVDTTTALGFCYSQTQTSNCGERPYCASGADHPCLYRGADYECVSDTWNGNCEYCELPTTTTTKAITTTAATTTSTNCANSCTPNDDCTDLDSTGISFDGICRSSNWLNSCPFCEPITTTNAPDPTTTTAATNCNNWPTTSCTFGATCDYYEGGVKFDGICDLNAYDCPECQKLTTTTSTPVNCNYNCVAGDACTFTENGVTFDGECKSGTFYTCPYCAPFTTTSTPVTNCNPNNHPNHDCVVDNYCTGTTTQGGTTTTYSGLCVVNGWGCPYCEPYATTGCHYCVAGEICEIYEGSVAYQGECKSYDDPSNPGTVCTFCEVPTTTTTSTPVNCNYNCVAGDACTFTENGVTFDGECKSGTFYTCPYCAPFTTTSTPVTNCNPNNHPNHDCVVGTDCEGETTQSGATTTYQGECVLNGWGCPYCKPYTTTNCHYCVAGEICEIYEGSAVYQGECKSYDDPSNPGTVCTFCEVSTDSTSTTQSAGFTTTKTTSTTSVVYDPCANLFPATENTCYGLAELDVCDATDASGAVTGHGTCEYVVTNSWNQECLKCVPDDDTETTKTPEESTSAPEESTSAPDESTAAPDGSTAAPDTTTKAEDTTTEYIDPNECDATVTLPFCWGQGENCKLTKKSAYSLLTMCRVCAEMETDSCQCEEVKSALLSQANTLSDLGLTPNMEQKIVDYCWQHLPNGCTGADVITVVNADVCDCSALFCDGELGENPTDTGDDDTADDDVLFSAAYQIGIRLSTFVTFLFYVIS